MMSLQYKRKTRVLSRWSSNGGKSIRCNWSSINTWSRTRKSNSSRTAISRCKGKKRRRQIKTKINRKHLPMLTRKRKNRQSKRRYLTNSSSARMPLYPFSRPLPFSNRHGIWHFQRWKYWRTLRGNPSISLDCTARALEKSRTSWRSPIIIRKP